MNEPTPIELPAAPGTPFDGSVRPYSLRGTSLDGPGEQMPYAFLRSELSGLVVEAIKSNGSRQSASVCVAVRQNGAASQLWRLDFFGRLHSALGNLVLETGAKGSLEIRPPVESAASQLWQFTDQNEIENTKSGLLLTSKNGSSLSKSLTVAKRRIGLSQTWLFEPAEPGTNIDARHVSLVTSLTPSLFSQEKLCARALALAPCDPGTCDGFVLRISRSPKR
jgi:hypothetical protein